MSFAPAWFLRIRDTAPNWAERFQATAEALTEGLLDQTTLSEYLAQSTPDTRAQSVIDAITGTVHVRVYDGNGQVMGEGTMGSPWATRSGSVLTIGETADFRVLVSGAPDPASWFIRFESPTRWVRGSFGLAGSGAACAWSLPDWTAGQFGTLGNVTIGVPSNTAPSLIGAPATLSFNEGVGGTYDFGQHGYDADGDTLTYSLAGTPYTGVSIHPTTGVLTVGTNATAATRDIRVVATDPGGLSTEWTCAVTVTEPSGDYSGVVVSDFEGYPLPGSTDISSPLAKPMHVTDSEMKIAAGSTADWFPLSYSPDSDTVFVSDISPRSGTRCALFRLDRDEPTYNAYLGRTTSGENERCEVRWMKPANTTTTLQTYSGVTAYMSNQDAWVGFSIFVPADWKATYLRVNGVPDLSRVRGGIISQFHHDLSPGDTEGNPPGAISLSGTKVNNVDVPAWDFRASYNRAIPALSETTVDRSFPTRRPVALGTWTDIVVQFRYHPWLGFMRAWIKDANSAGQFVQVGEILNGYGYAKNDRRPYWKIGPYFSFWNNDGPYIMVDKDNVEVRKITLRYDSIRYYDGTLASTALGIEYVRPR